MQAVRWTGHSCGLRRGQFNQENNPNSFEPEKVLRSNLEVQRVVTWIYVNSFGSFD